MELHVLGMNGPFPEPGGATSGYLLVSGETRSCLDLGCGTLQRLTALMAPERLTALVFSHWHYDHTSDVLPLLYRLQATGTVLPVWGPADEKSPIRAILEQDPGVEVHTIAPGDTVEIGDISLTAFSAAHPVPALMYRMAGEEKVFCYTGDTNRTSGLEAFARDADLLLADGLFTDDTWGAGKPHLSARMCGELATKANAKQLVITHLNPMIDKQTLLNEAREAYRTVRLAACGDTYVI
ncbi:MAG: MBL fold metallo-hydrolase [Clostridia bacterium]|nr:MBL fold metallo-hydrolase [Clostridia bacterium]